MLDKKSEKDEPRCGLLVEDTSVSGGVDASTGAPVIRPKTSQGRVDESTIPTDARERPIREDRP